MNTLFKPFLSLLFGATLLAPSFAFAEIKCECRLFGNYVSVGDKVCMHTPSGARMASCEMVQNNPSWIFEDNECPMALGMSPISEPIIKLALKLD
jgi:hypothetical protein